MMKLNKLSGFSCILCYTRGKEDKDNFQTIESGQLPFNHAQYDTFSELVHHECKLVRD